MRFFKKGIPQRTNFRKMVVEELKEHQEAMKKREEERQNATCGMCAWSVVRVESSLSSSYGPRDCQRRACRNGLCKNVDRIEVDDPACPEFKLRRGGQ